MVFANEECQKVIKDQINCRNIDFIDYQLDSVWIRDYAPIWLQCRETKEFKLANFPYEANHFGKSERDYHFSDKLSEVVGLPLELDFPRKKALMANYQNPELKVAMNKNKTILENLGYEIIEIPHSDREGPAFIRILGLR